jgi:hypothetical protein
MTRRTVVAASTGAILVALLTIRWAWLRPPQLAEGQGWLRQKAWDSREYSGAIASMLIVSTKRPDLVVDLPAETLQEEGYLVIQRARPIVGCLARQEGKGPVLYLDTNGDGRLSDERPLRRTQRTERDEIDGRRGSLGRRLLRHLSFNPPSQSTYFEFGPVVVPDPCHPVQKGESFVLTAEGPFFVFVHPAVYYEGEVRIGGGLHRIALHDQDLDGRLCGHFSPAAASLAGPVCDMMAIDLNGNGQFESSESFPLANLVYLHDAYYKLELSEDLKRLTFAPAQPQLGTVVVKTGDPNCEIRSGEAVLWSDAACGSFDLSSGTLGLPAGHYVLQAGHMEVRDGEGNIWSLAMGLEEEQRCQFDVSAGQTAQLRLGPPLTIGLRVRRLRTTLVSPILVGSGGELYYSAGTRRPPYTFFTILDEQGNVLYKGSYQGTWNAPPGFKGRIRVQVKSDIAPLHLRTTSPWYDLGTDADEVGPPAQPVENPPQIRLRL